LPDALTKFLLNPLFHDTTELYIHVSPIISKFIMCGLMPLLKIIPAVKNGVSLG
jgi:hypothetical protein